MLCIGYRFQTNQIIRPNRQIRVPLQRTRMVSSPITIISFQHTTISSPLPRKPHTPFPQKTVILTRQPVQVSTSTSVTQPRRQPLSIFTTSFARRSVIVHLTKSSPKSLMALFFCKYRQNRLWVRDFHPCLFLL